MSLINNLRAWWQVQTGEDETPFDSDSTAFVASLLFHLCLLLILGLMPHILEDHRITLTVSLPATEMEEPELVVHKDFAASDLPSPEIGANSVGGTEVALSVAPEISDISAVPTLDDIDPTVTGTVELNQQIQVATGLNFNQNLAVRGAAGEGVTGAVGAIDRLTQEILRSLEERKTLVAWFFDQSGSLERQRAAINQRFDRIYEELGVIEASGNPAFKKHESKPLLTSVFAFGQNVQLLTRQPTDNLAEIKAAVAGIKTDDSGVEKVFSAVTMGAEMFKHYRTRSPVDNQPERNVMLVVFSDEVGDDQDGLDATIAQCRRFGMPVYVVGVPAAFGMKETLVKWVDPDPKYDQTPQWGRVDQGPETAMPERVRVEVMGPRENDVDPMDAGFGPFALTRLCYETGGIYFAVHPNRNVTREVSGSEIDPFSAHLKYFFDPQIMRRYKPDYVSKEEYVRRASANKSRAALVTVSRSLWDTKSEKPLARFVRRSDADLAKQLGEAEKRTGRWEPIMAEARTVLQQGEADRARETTPRWQAGYDLAMGQVLASLVRAQVYNSLLAEIRQGRKFENPQNNTWLLVPATDDLPKGPWTDTAQQANKYLQRVIEEHPDTPWALVAKQELATPLGWRLIEEFTDLAPRPAVAVGHGHGHGGDGHGHALRVEDQRPPEPKPVVRPVPRL